MTETDTVLIHLIGFAEKSCSSDGTWSKRKADYVPCGPVQELKQRTHVHIVAYAVSAAALLPALVLFYLYKYGLSIVL